MAKGQQELLRQAEELKRSIEALRQSAQAAGVGDSAWQRQLQEIREQLDRALSPELRERLAALQRALKDLDAEQAKDALERLAEAQQEMREALERSRELFKRAAMEGDLANLAQESKDLAREQREWNQRVAAADTRQGRGRGARTRLPRGFARRGARTPGQRHGDGAAWRAARLRVATGAAGAHQMDQAAQAAQQGKRHPGQGSR